jgi:hypothetical protein
MPKVSLLPANQNIQVVEIYIGKNWRALESILRYSEYAHLRKYSSKS